MNQYSLNVIIHEDIFLLISQYLSNRQNIMATMTSKKMNQLKYKIIYNGKIKIEKIILLTYFNNFENVDICSFKSIGCLPKNIKHIHYEYYLPKSDNLKFVTTLTFKGKDFSMIQNNIPPSVTYLIIKPPYYANNIYNINIPHSVTHLKFSGLFINDKYKLSHDSIPPTITHLTFGYRFSGQIKGSIPSSVTHLTFGRCFDQSIKDSIPSSVTHLTFGYEFDQCIKNNIPSSIISLTLYPYNKDKTWRPTQYCWNDIPETISYVTLNYP